MWRGWIVKKNKKRRKTEWRRIRTVWKEEEEEDVSLVFLLMLGLRFFFFFFFYVSWDALSRYGVDQLHNPIEWHGIESGYYYGFSCISELLNDFPDEGTVSFQNLGYAFNFIAGYSFARLVLSGNRILKVGIIIYLKAFYFHRVGTYHSF
jgi:hypothetical protein